MDEYLKRSDLLAEYDRQHKGPPGAARRLIAEAPAADVVPVVHGRWEEVTWGNMTFTKCSNCNSKVQWYLSEQFNYCPLCGARMDGADE